MASKNQTTVSFSLSLDEFAEFEEEARDAGYTSAGLYAKALCQARGEAPAPMLDPDSQGKLLRLQGANELLQNQLDVALAKLTSGAALAGVPEKTPSTKEKEKTVQEMVEAEMAKRDFETLKKDHAKLQKEHEKLEADYEALDDQYDELQRKANKDDRFDRLVPQALGAVVNVAANRFPAEARALTEALGSIAAGGVASPAGLPSNDDPTAALLLELNTALTEDQKPQVHNILNGLMDYPELIPSVEAAVSLGAQKLAHGAGNTPA